MSKIRHSRSHKTQHGHTINPTLEDALEHASFETRTMLLDALACVCHNEGHGLAGNTAVFDQEWLARRMWAGQNPFKHANHWENVSAEDRTEWMEIAKVALDALPQLMGRISSRYLSWESALRSMWQVSRAAEIAARNMYVEKLPDRTKQD